MTDYPPETWAGRDRIVACLNACAGIPTEQLGNVQALVAAAEEIRAELKEFYDGEATCDHSVGICYCGYWCRREQLDAALGPFRKD